jgi:hypothetical protein
MRVFAWLAAIGAGVLLTVLYAVLGLCHWHRIAHRRSDARRRVADSAAGLFAQRAADHAIGSGSACQCSTRISRNWCAANRWKTSIFQHSGVGYAGVLRALFVDITTRIFAGANPITMQAARGNF